MSGVWICKASATCDDCNKEYCSNNAMGLMAKHCKKYGHNGQVSMIYAIHYDGANMKSNTSKNSRSGK